MLAEFSHCESTDLTGVGTFLLSTMKVSSESEHGDMISNGGHDFMERYIGRYFLDEDWQIRVRKAVQDTTPTTVATTTVRYQHVGRLQQSPQQIVV